METLRNYFIILRIFNYTKDIKMVEGKLIVIYRILNFEEQKV